MNTIKFSHNYPKLHGQTSAVLLAVCAIKINAKTPPELLEYDTTTCDGDHYPLKHGNYIQLVFLGNLRIPFCTIRSAYPPSKVLYYKNNVGCEFQIKVPPTPPAEPQPMEKMIAEECFRRARDYKKVFDALKKMDEIVCAICNEECCCYGHEDEISKIESLIKQQEKEMANVSSNNK